MTTGAPIGGTEPPAGFRAHRFMGESIDLPDNLTETQLDGRACIRCGASDQPMRPVEASSEQSAQLFECVNQVACMVRSGDCPHCRRGPIRPDDSQECLDCGVVFVSDG